VRAAQQTSCLWAGKDAVTALEESVMKSSLGSALVLGACLLGTLALSPLARADSQLGAPTKVVRLQDLDLNTVQGVRILYGRLQSAAGQVCAPFEHLGHLVPSTAWRSCYEQAIATAVHRVDSPLLTAYYERQEGQLIASAGQLTRARE
jgi:UrcA family protein